MVANVVSAVRMEGTQKSWHGLETTISPEDAKDLNKVLAAGGINWNAYSVPLLGVKVDPETTETEMLETHHIGVFRDSDNALLGVHGKDYQIHQPREVLAPYHALVVDSDGKFRWDFVASLKGGRLLTAMAVLEEDTEIVSELHKTYLMATTSFDGTQPTILGASTVRIVCQNTHRLAMSSKDTKKLRYKHRSAMKGADEVHKQLESSLMQVDLYKSFAEEIARMRLSKDAAIEFLRESIFKAELKEVEAADGSKVKVWTTPSTRQKNLIEKLERSFETTVSEIGSDVTGWTVWNAITRYADHEKGSRKTEARQRSGDSEAVINFENNLFGYSDKFKQEQQSRLIDFVANENQRAVAAVAA